MCLRATEVECVEWRGMMEEGWRWKEREDQRQETGGCGMERKGGDQGGGSEMDKIM